MKDFFIGNMKAENAQIVKQGSANPIQTAMW